MSSAVKLSSALARHGSLDGLACSSPSRHRPGRHRRGLRHAGALVTDVVAYRTVLEDAQQEDGPDVYRLLLDNAVDVVTFTSPSAVRNFASIYGKEQTIDLLARTTVAVIGPVTAEAATQLGLAVTIQPATSTIPALVEAIAARHGSAVRAYVGHGG
jgi:uroporphyrinogen III methyltransferase/synthase